MHSILHTCSSLWATLAPISMYVAPCPSYMVFSSEKTRSLDALFRGLQDFNMTAETHGSSQNFAGQAVRLCMHTARVRSSTVTDDCLLPARVITSRRFLSWQRYPRP